MRRGDNFFALPYSPTNSLRAAKIAPSLQPTSLSLFPRVAVGKRLKRRIHRRAGGTRFAFFCIQEECYAHELPFLTSGGQEKCLCGTEDAPCSSTDSGGKGRHAKLSPR